MTKTETPPTIAELWGEFQKTFKHKPAMYLRHAANKGIEVTRYAKPIADAAIKYQSLRQQLVERLDLIKVDTPNNRHAYMLFGFTGSNDESISFIPRNDHDEEFKPTIEQCNELSAMFAFCGWELQQREKEAANG